MCIAPTVFGVELDIVVGVVEVELLIREVTQVAYYLIATRLDLQHLKH